MVYLYLFKKTVEKLKKSHAKYQEAHIALQQTQKSISLLQKEDILNQNIKNRAQQEDTHIASHKHTQETLNYNDLLRSFPQYDTKLDLPVLGKIITHHDYEIPIFHHDKLMAINPTFNNNQAEIRNPFDGRIIYAKKYLQQKYVVIIEHKENFYTTIIGIDEARVKEGQILLGGEIIGLIHKAESDKNKVFVQLQEGSSYLDPTKWYKK